MSYELKTKEDVDKLVDELTQAERLILRHAILVQKARKFNADGFAAFFELLMGMKLPSHQRQAIDASFKAYSKGKGIVIEMFRGAAKTTVFNTALSCFLIGHFPTKSGFLIQVGDDISRDNSSAVAHHIENNPGFEAVFPHIVPDKDRGWGANGYFVKRDDISRPEWTMELAGNKDPTFVGMGYKSRAIIGKRPYWLILDDINDENNTSSEREAIKVETILTGTIFPAANMADFIVVIGTPWNENDALHYCLATKEFDHIKIPVVTEEGYTWPEKFGAEEVEKQRNLAGEIEFARMFLLDLEKTKGLVLKKEWLNFWPNEQINQDWPVFIGIDFTSTEDPTKRNVDYFALAVGRAIPGKGLVIEDGLRARLSQADAEGKVIAWCAKYPTLHQVGVEAIITGRMFYNNLLNNAEMRASGIVLYPVTFNKSKGYRFEKVMAPLFQRSRVFISDANNNFLRAFRDEWVNWQGDALEDMYHNDTLDAVYAMLVAAEPFVTPIANLKRVGANNPLFMGEEEKRNPFSAFGSR